MTAMRSIATVVQLDLEAGDVAARTSILCQHGEEGFCYDDALPDERAAVDFIHHHAYAYALPEGADVAEEYASWCVRESWFPGAVIMGGSHSRDFERFRQQRESA